MDIKGIQDELFRQEYPYLHAGSDPDIERYCYLRSTGQGQAALNIYQFRLKPRYPDDTLRTALLRSFRSRDPLFPRLLLVAYHRLAKQSLERIFRIIDYISEKVKTYKKQDVYSTIKTVEDILRVLPREQYEAVSNLDRMCRYAQVLNHQAAFMEQAAELVRSYLSRSLPVLEQERSRRRQDLNPKRPEIAGDSPADFSTVTFSDEDLARIEIPSRFTRVEDKTLIYCMKYWNLVNDAAFEQILSLYSRKYGKKNHTVYVTIRRGRNANYRDEDILSSVMSTLVTGYYYSVLGDRYLQQNWRVIKNAMERAAPAGPAAKPAVAAKPEPPKTPPVVVKHAAPKPAAKPAKVKRAATKPAAVKPAAAEPVAPKPAVVKPAAVEPPAPKPVVKPAAAVVKPAPQPPLPKPPQPAGGSVSDRLRKLSGRGYDLYQDRFLAHVRPAIRKVLGTGRGIFFALPEKAEDLVYRYLHDHYADPYMNWPESEERRQLAEQGFNLPSLDPVIDECFRKINRE
ncbi:MAG: hypothetical protein LBI94_03745 [Treponema sp.]|jgi:hypothetical protein|nr:hypothetical protein [Treponema sp.]